MEVQTLSQDEADVIHNNVRLLMRSLGVSECGNSQVWTPTIDDVVHSVDLVDTTIQDSLRMCGQYKHATREFDVVRETILEIREVMMSGSSPQEIARKRRLNTATFHLIVVPVALSFKKFSHKETLAHHRATTDWVKNIINSFSDYGSHDDGLVANRLVRTISAHKEQQFRKSFAVAK